MRTLFSMGFALSPTLFEVVMIQKLRPAKYRGCWTGVGGHIENETPIACMAREFEEETGLVTNEDQWTQFAIAEVGDHGRVELFYSIGLPIHLCSTKTDEMVEIMKTADVLSSPAILVEHTALFMKLAKEHVLWSTTLPINSKAVINLVLP